MREIGECLPECETGSVERMLEAAIVWSERLEPRNSTSMPGFKVYECETKEPLRVAPSQTQLLRNILEKMRERECECNVLTELEEAQNSHGIQMMFCPVCHASLMIQVRVAIRNPHG